jgi:Flp pilus assembly protein TadB
MDAQVSRQLKQVIRRTRNARRLRGLAWLWSLLALVAALAWSIAPAAMPGATVALILLTVGLLGTLWATSRRQSKPAFPICSSGC